MKRMESNRLGRVSLMIAVFVLTLGCDDSGDDSGEFMAMGGEAVGGESMGMGGQPDPNTQMEIRGVFTDNWDLGHEITAESWTQSGESPSVTTFTVVSNADEFAVGQNAPDHPYSPNLWSRFDWTFDVTGLYYCQIAYNAADEATALAADSADVTDLEGGCNENPWSTLTPATAPEFMGTYTDGFGPHIVEAGRWVMGEGEDLSYFVFTTVDNEADYAIAKNDGANPFFPGLWSRFEWLDDGDGTFFYCQAPYNGPSADAAHDAVADREDPANAGCGMFSWSTLSAP